MNPVKIFIADDHQLIIDGIKSILCEVENIEITGEAGNGLETLEKIKKQRPDIIFMDIDMPVMNGMEATRQIKKKFPGIKIIVLTMLNDKALIKQMLNAGASGFVLKNAAKKEIIDSVHKVMNGEIFLSAEISLTMIKPSLADVLEKPDYLPVSVLSEREIEILTLIAKGSTSNDIAKKLFISKRTADTHRNNIMNKLEIRNISNLIKYAIKNGLV